MQFISIFMRKNSLTPDSMHCFTAVLLVLAMFYRWSMITIIHLSIFITANCYSLILTAANFIITYRFTDNAQHT